MTDESQLQLTSKHGDSSLSLSTARSGLIARGRRDAATLAVRLSSVARKADQVSTPEGICNKCGERRELVLLDCVCHRCSDSLDKQWADAKTTDWVLLTTFVPEGVIGKILQALKERRAKEKGVAATLPNRYIHRNTSYVQMKSYWAACNPPYSLFLGPATPDDIARMRSYGTTSAKRSDTAFIRPATPEEIAEHDATQRDEQRADVVSEVLEKWGFEDEGIPCSGVWDDDTRRRVEEVFQETKKRLEQLGLLEESGYEYEDASARLAAKIRRLAEEGDADAQFDLGDRYYDVSDFAEAVLWFRKAAEQGAALARCNLGYMYYNGQGVARDYSEAVHWFRKAAGQGNATAQCSLGLMYRYGEGVPRDSAEAVRWYRKAAEQGNTAAQFSLGLMYDNGQGVVPQDLVESHMWLTLAASDTSRDAQKRDADRRENVARKMTSEQIAEAQRRAREWKPAKEK